YHVMEWAKSQTANPQGPFFYDSRVAILDGKTGQTVADRYVSKDIRVESTRTPVNPQSTALGSGFRGPAYSLWYEPLGDVDHDGVPDLLQHEVKANPDYRHNLTVVSGKDASPLWTFSLPRDFRTLVLGDADGDGA